VGPSRKTKQRRLAVLLASACWAASPAARSEGPTLAVGLCTGDLRAAKEAGFDFAELRIREIVALPDADFARFEETHRAVGLTTPVGNWFLPPELKVVGPAVDLEAAMRYVRKAFDRSRRLGIERVVFGSGEARRVPEGFPREEAFRQLVAFGQRVAAEAGPRGLVVVIEPLRKQESNLVNTAAEALAWVEAVGHPSFQLMVDLFHLTEEAEDPSIIVRAAPHLRHVHVCNPRGRVFPLPADGFDYAPFLSALRRIGYRGGVSIEASTDDLRGEGPRAIAFLRAAWAAAR
jgi:D-psicose/D-tagatose/L-ribulose 3-epimerase